MPTIIDPGPLADYDVILINTSAGKDSQTTLRVVSEMAREQGVSDRVVVVHADLERADWDGTRALAEEQVGHYGHRFIATLRHQGDILDHVIDRDKTLRATKDKPTPPWPTPARRWCTSDHKRSPIYRVMTMLVSELRLGRPVKILNVMGIRAQESKKRATYTPFAFDEKASNKTKRHVWTWYPIFQWVVEEVWADINAHDVPHHWAYDEGMPRLSCALCFLASKPALMRAAQLNPVLADKFADIEQQVVGTFKQNLSIAEIIEAARNAPEAVVVPAWCD